MPDLGIPRENIVFISGIGCSSRFPYYMNTYGFHTIHGRAPAIATGLRVARPDLKVFVVTGDGDGLSIGGNHMLHVLRRNVARTVDRNIQHMEEMLKRAAAHKGTGFIEILQNCNVYNDLAWNVIYDKASKLAYELRLEHGKPLLYGPPDARKAVIMDGVMPKVVDAKDVQESALWIHDEKNVNAAKILADLFAPDFPVPIGVLEAIEAPIYEEVMLDQEQPAISERRPGSIAKLLTSGDTWKIGQSPS